MIRRRYVYRGVVQGVGFRPTVWRVATAMELAGFVRNDDRGVTVELEGEDEAVAAFPERLRRGLPALARIESLEVVTLPPRHERGFRVAETAGARRGDALVPADAALCAACRAELEDPADRRHRHPFTNCTACGPRYTVVRALPYDRARTSMACFPPCPRCAAEYADPQSRRFHAEPIACPECGPRVWLVEGGAGTRAGGDAALARARGLLAEGALVAVKGLGGFQLLCRADREASVARLRDVKRRAARPFAVMARDLATVHRLVALRPADADLLTGSAAPILLAPRRAGAPVAEAVAPGLGDLGVMLPTTPLHVELFRDAPYAALVATSGNRGDEPICTGNREARLRLRGLADAFLLHDRDIVRRVDDSVVRAVPDGHAVVRRSRGYVPRGLPLPAATGQAILALGGHLQTTACVALGATAFPSQHVGDLDTEEARGFLAEVALGLEGFLGVEALVLVHDLHPDYPSGWLARRLAERRGARTLAVQHHLAHAAAVLAEHDAFPAPGSAAAALVLDGTGYGMDGTAWGGELLVVDGELRWRRAGGLACLPLVGGERAVREPWRVLASGAGRVFEACGALLGLGPSNGYEGELAARLETLAAGAAPAEPWPEVGLQGTRIPGAALLAAAAQRVLAGEAHAAVARGLHRTLARLVVQLAARVLPDLPRSLGLGGGCLVNRLLREDLSCELAAAGWTPLLPQAVPAGDGGLSFGQAVLGALAEARGTRPEYRGGLNHRPGDPGG